MRRLLLALALLLAGCGAQAQERTQVTVLAAASLQRAFTAAATAYEASHPGVDVVLSFAGSQTLVAQVRQGAPADLLATADVPTVASVRSSLRRAPQVFAHNRLAVVTAPGNPERVTSLADLARPGLRVVLAAPSVPAGRAAARALAAAGVAVRPVSLADAVTGVIGAVRLGEADAGIAYVTDLGAGVAGTPVPGTRTDLALGVLTSRGEGFAGFLLGAEGRAVLARFGFA